MKKVGVTCTPLARALAMSASTRARPGAWSVSSSTPNSSATLARSSSVSVAERVISLTCASQNDAPSGADSAMSAARRAMSLPVIGRCRNT